jgi:hypothetical protein
VRFAGAGRAEEADVGGLVDPGQLREVLDQRPLGARLGSEIEVFKRLRRREARGADPLPRAGRLARHAT